MRPIGLFLSLAALLLGSAEATTLFFAGDSTLDEYECRHPPYASWGRTLSPSLRDGVTIGNYAQSGAWTASFVKGGRWGALIAGVKPGDFVIIEFGHNEKDPDDYRAHIRRFVGEVRAKGGTPMLLSPIARGTFDDAGRHIELRDEKGVGNATYTRLAKELADELGVDFVDKNRLTSAVVAAAGQEGSRRFYRCGSRLAKMHRTAPTDVTHPILAGADRFAKLFLDEVRARRLPVAALFREPDDPPLFDCTAPYAVVDLSAGWRATNWPVRCSLEGPDLADERCRTTELWLRLVPAGVYTMGSPTNEFGRNALGRETQHRVTVSKPFYLGVFEVTQRQYELVTGRNPSECRGADRPVDTVSYADLRGRHDGAAWPQSACVDADSFFGRLQSRTSLRFDLPTEAMWEYACRAGATEAFNDRSAAYTEGTDTNLNEIARYCYNVKKGEGGYAEGHTRVGTYLANAWGLHDMHGNVSEWCLDWYAHDLGAAPATDPAGPPAGRFRTVRGGSWGLDIYSGVPTACRSAARGTYGFVDSLPETGYKLWGFRACLYPERPAANPHAPVPAPEESSLFVRHVDPDSRVESLILRPGLLGHNQQGLYFTANSMTDDGRFLLFDVSDDESAPDFPKNTSDLSCAFVRRKAVADLLRGEVYELGGKFGGNIPFLDTKAAKVYDIHYDGLHCRDLRADPMKDIVVCPVPKELHSEYSNPQFALATHLTLLRDRTKAYLDTRSLVGPSRVGVLDFATGAFTPWTSLEFYANHGQISPTRDDEAIGAWDSGRSLVWSELSEAQRKVAKGVFPQPFVTDQARPVDTVYPRLWFFRADGTARMIPSRINNYATHEHFTRDGRGITFCRGSNPTHGSSFTLHDLETDVQRDIVPYMTTHGALSADGRYVVFDVPVGEWWRGCPWRVGFWDRKKHRGIWIHTAMPEYRPRLRQSVLHPDPHPNFMFGERYVVCTAYGPDRRMNVSLTPTAQLKAMLDAMPDPTPKSFPVAWDPANPVDRTYELAFDWRRMVEEGRVDGPAFGVTWRPHTVYALEATAGGERRRIALDPLPGRDWRDLVLRFRVPEGTTALTLLADLPEQFEVRDTVTCDNLFAGVVEPAHPFGVTDRRFELAVPAAVRGKNVRLEWKVRNQSGKPARDAVRAVALRADGSAAGGLFAAADIGGAFEADRTTTVYAEGTVPADATTIRLEVVPEGEFLTTRLVLREGTSLPATF